MSTQDFTAAPPTPGAAAPSGGQAEQVKQQAQDKVQEVAGQAKEQGQQVAGQAKEQARAQVDQRSTQAGEQVSSAASDAHSVAEELEKQGKDKPAKMVRQVAEKAEQAGSYLQEANSDRLLHDVEDFGREKPWAIAAAGLAVGFAASRFLKASSSERYGSVDTAQVRAQRFRASGTTPPRAGTGNLSSGVIVDPPPVAPAAGTFGAPTPAVPPVVPATPRTV
jgi:ElaB/YqjD/DUF883 family membrane-anchored ribosome-binding protein